VANRFSDTKKLISVLEKIGNEFIDDSNYDIQLERCQDHFKDLFPIFNKILFRQIFADSIQTSEKDQG